jgi:tRNA/rRNA methyltransferase
MSFWTYILKCADGSYYAGHSDNLEARMGQHHGGVFNDCYTFRRRPLELVWAETFQTRIEALEAERKIKGWSRPKKEALIRGDWDAVQRLAQRRTSFETGLRVRSVPPHDERIIDHVPSPQPVRAEEVLKPQAEAPSRSNTNPIIILVRPQLGENIGKAARAMLNFGLTELRLVAPRDGWPNPDAGPAAAGADVVLEKAQVFDTLAEATADIQHIYATTVRKRGVTKPVLTPEVAANEIVKAQGSSAILFGAERSGLETEDVAVARAIITVPINPEFGSLNLAQAVILCAYEWSKHQALASPPKVDLDPPAPQAELDGMIEHLFGLLERRDFFFPRDREHATRLTLRNLLTKPGWNSLEVRTLRGVLSAFDKRHPKSD